MLHTDKQIFKGRQRFVLFYKDCKTQLVAASIQQIDNDRYHAHLFSQFPRIAKILTLFIMRKGHFQGFIADITPGWVN